MFDISKCQILEKVLGFLSSLEFVCASVKR